MKRTAEQKAWMRSYKDNTCIEFADDPILPFEESARKQLRWYEAHASDAHMRLERELSDLIYGAAQPAKGEGK